MCLGVPLRIKEVKEDNTAIAEMGNSTIEISTIFTPEVKEGDYVIVHAGFSITILSEEEAKDIKSLLEEMEE